jgi:hypothetical protein
MSGIEKLDPQLQGQLVEALGLLKDVVEEMGVVAPEAIADIKAVVWQIFEENGEEEEITGVADNLI